MKKFISVTVAVSLLISSFAIVANGLGADYDLGFSVASDLHYNIPNASLEKIQDDPIYWYANRRAAMEEESGYIIDEFLNMCAADDDCEYVLISGDLVDHGKTIIEEHYAVAQKLREFEKTSGKQVFVIDGNHDLGEGKATDAESFKEIYAEFGYNEALVKDEKTCSYTADLGEKYRLIALDSCDYNASTSDGLTSERLSWVKEQAEIAKADGRYPILMMHHNLLDHMPIQGIINSAFIVKNHYAVAEKFADWGIKLVFTGHEHCSDGATYTSALGNVIYDFATTSLTMYPLQYRAVKLNDSEITYEAKTVDSIDTGALSSNVSGYTDDMLNLMNAGLNNYALGFLKAGIEYRLSLSLTPEKLGIKDSDIYYNLVMTAVNGLTDILEMPLYGENSVQELAEKSGLIIPESNYKNGWDLVTSLVAMHYEGSENFNLESPEVTILLRTASLILKTDLAAVSDEIFGGAAETIIAKAGTSEAADKLASLGIISDAPVTPGEYFIIAIASPLLYSFVCDDDGVDDNNGTLPGYGTSSFSTNLKNISANITNIIEKIIKYVNLIFKYLSLAGVK